MHFSFTFPYKHSVVIKQLHFWVNYGYSLIVIVCLINIVAYPIIIIAYPIAYIYD
jgi:hypothetical protein